MVAPFGVILEQSRHIEKGAGGGAGCITEGGTFGKNGTVAPNNVEDNRLAINRAPAEVTRLVTRDEKATMRPSALILGRRLSPLPWIPLLSKLTSWVCLVIRSCAKASFFEPLSSGTTRLVA